MPNKCELLKTCGFFNNFNTNLEVINQRWIKLYCDDREHSELCERKKIRNQTGKPPVDNMAPTGMLM